MANNKPCLQGLNWGQLNLQQDYLTMQNEQNQKIFQLPLKGVQNCIYNKQGKDITIEFDGKQNDVDVLTEIRLYIPQQTHDKKEDDEEDEQSKENSQQGEQQENEENFAANIYKQITEKINVNQSTGDSIVTIPDLQLNVPRGKYTLDMFRDQLRLHGASYNYVIKYKNIDKSFLLPNPDGAHVSFVIGFDKPLKQGNTTYPYIIMHLKDKEVEEPIQIKCSEAERQALGLEEKYTSNFYQTVGLLFKKITQITIFVPGQFKSHEQLSCLKCNNKTTAGFLYPLQKSFIFINKPVYYIPFKEIDKIEFFRVSGQPKLFDIKIYIKNSNNQGGKDNKKIKIDFSSFDRKELEIFKKFLEEKKITYDINKEDRQVNLSEGSVGSVEEDSLDQEKKQRRIIKKKQIDEGQIPDDDSEDDSSFEGDDIDDEDDEISDDAEEEESGAMEEEEAKPNKGKKAI